MNMRCVAFDLGASSGKLFCGQFNGERLSLEPVYSFKNGIVQLGNSMYWDFLEIYRQLTLGLRMAAKDGTPDSLGIDSFNNDFSLISQTGDLLCPVRSYRDNRTELLRDAIYRRMSAHDLYMQTGNQIAPFNTLMQLAAMIESGQRYLLEGADRFLHVPDLLAYYLTGEKATEFTLAAETQLMNLRTHEWLDDLFTAFDIPRHLFGNVVEPGTKLGKLSPQFCAQTGLESMEFISVCEHDTASAFLAAPVDRDSVLISSGTWSLVGIETDEPVITEYGYQCNIANEGSIPGHHRLLCNVMGSWIIQELINDFATRGMLFDYAQVVQLALNAKAFQYLIDVDDHTFFAPGNMAEKIRQKCKIHYGRTPEMPGEFFRCVYESLAIKYRLTIEKLETITGRKLSSIHIIGGGARDAVGNQFTASACARPVISGPFDATAVGNILIQLISLGKLTNIEEGRDLVSRSFPVARYYPQGREEWDEQYQLFKERFGY